MNNVRVRFAPSPTGFMHLGNVRTALFNYIFAQKKQGTFIVRVEDTDASRNLDEAGVKIFEDLAWLGLNHTEGPYFQSQRTDIYQEKLDQLIADKKVYRCFCTAEELERKRQRQRALKKPPRYDRSCLKLAEEEIQDRLDKKIAYIWRLRLNQDMVVSLQTMERGVMQFHLKNFSDFALTRPDGSCTFMFANFVDDWLMNITHAIRGEDHLTNTAMQAALYNSFSVKMPVFWHLPLLSNKEGKKLSKRDFGFSLDDLKNAGYIAEAIGNYLAIIGGSFEKEILSFDELAHAIDFDNIHATGAITYDVDKLNWVNHQWLMRISDEQLHEYAKPFIIAEIPQAADIPDEKLSFLLSKIRKELRVLTDVPKLLAFYFTRPTTSMPVMHEKIGQEVVDRILRMLDEHHGLLDDVDQFLSTLKKEAQAQGIKQGQLWQTVRYLLTGSFQGIGMHDLCQMLSVQELRARLVRKD